MRTNRGMTLIEILAVSLLLVVIVVGFLGLFSVSFALNETSRNTVVALNDITTVLEDMRNIDPFTVTNLQVAFPDGAAVAGFNNLENEAVVVQYSNVTLESVTATVEVSWQERTRKRSESIATIMTKR